MSYTETQRREASEWFVTLRDARELPDETLQAWEQWFAASEGNALAFKAVEQAYHQSAVSLAAPLMVDRQVDDYDGSMSIAAWHARTQVKVSHSHPSRTVREKPFWLAAAVIVLTLAGWVARQWWVSGSVIDTGEVATQIGQHREVRLSDGSHIALGAHSRLTVHLTPNVREVRLEAGEAFFNVKKDPRRLFVVRALHGSITALGTAFNVRTTGDRLTVAVTEGAVRVNDTVRLKSGEQLSFDPLVAKPVIKAAAIVRFDKDDPTRWRDGWLVYRNEPLREVIADVSRYSAVPLSVAEGVPENLRFTGMIHQSDVAEWLTALPEIFPVRLKEEGTALRIEPRVNNVAPTLPFSGGSAS